MAAKILLVPGVVFALYFLACLFGPRRSKVTLLLIFKNQEEAVEGFLRKFLAFCHWGGISAEVLVMDDDSRDLTLLILSRLSREFSFKLYGVQEKLPFHTRCLDARGLSGKELARLSLTALIT